MHIPAPALASIIALVIVVVVSCINQTLNVGILAISFAIIVAGIFSNLSGTAVMGYFPTSLFLILVGVTFMFGIAQSNGTMEKVTAYSVRMFKGNNLWIPLIVYLLTSVLTAIGPGNIAATALLAPVMLAVAARVGMPAFLMTLLIVGAANGSAFSPFAPTGIISNGLIAKMSDALGIAASSLNGLAWKINFNSIISQGFVNIGGFMIMGGWTWMMHHKDKTIDINEMVPKPEPLNKQQLITILAIVLLIVMVVFPGIPFIKAVSPKPLLNMAANVGSVAFVLSGFLLLFNAGDSKKALGVMPWGVILMVCGVFTLIEVMSQSGGLKALTQIIGSISNPTTANGWLGFITGVISAYSSSSGVVMPMFLPMVPGLIKEIGGGDPISLISSINVGAHLVDTSPLSTLGALCIACAGEHEDKGALFRKLLVWGLSMSVIGGIICYLAFGLLNI